jgi:hypothetical protein
MRRRFVRLSLAALAVAATSVVIPLGASADQDDVREDVAAGLGDFGACLDGSGEGSLVLLLDKSSSLEDTDPQNGRRVAAVNLMEGLTRYTETRDAPLDVLVAGFAADFEKVGEWTAADAQNLDQLTADVDAATGRTVTVDTDYVNALEGARQALADKASDGGSARGCEAIVWFSDGKHFIDTRTSDAQSEEFGAEKPYAPGADLRTQDGSEQARQSGEAELCRPAGVGDQLRSAGITLIGVGLSAEGGASAADFELMRNVTEGTECGDVTEPPGVFHPASSIEELIGALDALAQSGSPLPSQGPRDICQGGVCAEGASEFTLDDSITSVHILALTDVAGTHAVLVQPDGQEVALPGAGESYDGPAAVSWLTPKSLTIDLARSDFDEVWSGPWRIAVVDPSSKSQGEQADLTIHLSSSIETRWPTDLSRLARAGEVLEGVQLDLVDSASGETIDPASILGSIAVDGTIVDAAGTRFDFLEQADASSIAVPVSVDLADAVPGPARVEIRTTITTASATRDDGTKAEGSRLEPRESSTAFNLAPAADFPALDPVVDFGTLDGALTAEAAVRVTGPGCVWLNLDATTVAAAPSLAGAAAIESPASTEATCVSVPAGQNAEVPVSLAVDDYANGAVSGTLSVVTAPLDELTRTSTVPVEFRADLRKPVDAGTAWLVAALFFVGGLLPPLAILYGVKWRTARIPQGTYRIAVVRAVIDHNGRADVELPNESDIAMVRGGDRAIPAGPYRLAAHMSPSPFGRTKVLLEGTDAPSVSSALPARVGTRAVLPQDIINRWVAVADQGVGAQVVTVILVLGKSRQQWDMLVNDARANVGRAVRDLQSEVAADDPAVEPETRVGAGVSTAAHSQKSGAPSDPWAGPASRERGRETPWSAGPDSSKNSGW